MKKYHLWILGCAMNYSDAERIASVFGARGYEMAKRESEADLIVTVACSVRQKAVDRIYGKVKPWNKKRAKNPGFKTILCGCVLPEDRQKLSKSFDLIFKIQEISKLEDFIQNYDIEYLNQNSKFEINNSRKDYFSIIPSHQSSFRAHVPIMTGCDNFCSYCAVPYTKGREKSRPQQEIVNELKALVKNGYKEIILLGQNVNSYGKAKSEKRKVKSGEPFVALLKEIDKIPGDYRVYFYSNHPKDMSADLIKALPTLKHFPHYLHLPLQSGDDKLLKRMNRHYTAEQYLDLVKTIRKHIPDIVLTTDIIVGFPGEGVKEFEKTLEIINKVGFEMIFIGQYSPRSGTASAKLEDDVPKTVKKERDRIVTANLRYFLQETNKTFVGQAVRVLIDERKAGIYFGRTEGYRVVEIKTDQPLSVGRFYSVKITDSSAWKLFGSINRDHV